MSESSVKARPLFSPGPDLASPVSYGVTCRGLGNMKEMETRIAALKQAGLGDRPAYFLKQVHGTEIIRVTERRLQEASPEGDGWITDAAGVVLCVFAADCPPLFIWEKSGKAAGVFHAGWRGLEKGMPRLAVSAFSRHFGIQPARLEALIGPRIGACCYRVGPETASRFPQSVVGHKNDETFLDLAAEAMAQLKGAGVSNPVDGNRCTSCERETFFSYRRDKDDSRMMAFISLNGS